MQISRNILLLLVALLLTASSLSAQEALAVGDRVRVWVKGEPDLTVERVVSSDGSISYPLIGNIGVNGLKPHEAARVIARMLDDGYIRQPLVQVEIMVRSSTRAAVPQASAMDERREFPLPETAGPGPLDAMAGISSGKAAVPVSRMIEIVDGKTGSGIGNAAMLLGGKIYQSNRLGQMIVENPAGRILLLADGYKILQGPIDRFLREGDPARILMDKVAFAGEITIKIVDADSGKPLAGVTVKLDEMSVKTNLQGVFKVKDIQKEFGEVKFEKAGYKTLRKIMDFKGPAEQVLALKRNE